MSVVRWPFVRRFVRITVSLGALACAWAPGVARADLRELAGRVNEQWARAGARTVALPSRFIYDDESLLVPVPPPAEGDGACTHVAIIGSRGMSFRARLSDASTDPLDEEPGARASSLAGVLELQRCGGKAVRHVAITSAAGRGALEIVVGRVRGTIPSLASVVPERTGGALPAAPEPGNLPIVVPASGRADSAEARARLDGGRVAAREIARPGEDGNGEIEMVLTPGCHRLELFAVELRGKSRVRFDVDAEMRHAADGALLASDRTEAPDARLEACVGEPTPVGVVFVGAPPRGRVLVSQSTWPLPARLPPLWGPVVRSHMARALFQRHVAVPPDEPVLMVQGGAGTTPVRAPGEVGACYVAVVGLTHGQVRAFELRARIGGRESTDDRGAAFEAALTSYCVYAHEKVSLEVQARGAGLAWALAVFRVRSAAWPP